MANKKRELRSKPDDGKGGIQIGWQGSDYLVSEEKEDVEEVGFDFLGALLLDNESVIKTELLIEISEISERLKKLELRVRSGL